MRTRRPAAWDGDGAGQALPGVGAQAEVQQVAVLQPDHVRQGLPINLAVQPHVLSLQDAVLLSGA